MRKIINLVDVVVFGWKYFWNNIRLKITRGSDGTMWSWLIIIWLNCFSPRNYMLEIFIFPLKLYLFVISKFAMTCKKILVTIRKRVYVSCAITAVYIDGLQNNNIRKLQCIFYFILFYFPFFILTIKIEEVLNWMMVLV